MDSTTMGSGDFSGAVCVPSATLASYCLATVSSKNRQTLGPCVPI